MGSRIKQSARYVVVGVIKVCRVLHCYVPYSMSTHRLPTQLVGKAIIKQAIKNNLQLLVLYKRLQEIPSSDSYVYKLTKHPIKNRKA